MFGHTSQAIQPVNVSIMIRAHIFLILNTNLVLMNEQSLDALRSLEIEVQLGDTVRPNSSDLLWRSKLVWST